MIIGVFDSGVGGLSVVNAIKEALPDLTIDYREDHEHVPYGTKTAEELYGYVAPILQAMIDDGARLIVIACNTVTTTLIDRLRSELSVPLIGIEPMVRQAALHTKSRCFAVCATPSTLQSKRYLELKYHYASGMNVLEPDCSDWAEMIELNQVNRQILQDRIEPVIAAGADIIVLGCTHYHWIEQEINTISAGRARVLQPESAIVTQLQAMLQRLV